MPIGQPDSPDETYADRLVREAMEQGWFDDLPGSGKPLPGLGEPDDDMWWVRNWLRRNSLDQSPSNSE